MGQRACATTRKSDPTSGSTSRLPCRQPMIPDRNNLKRMLASLDVAIAGAVKYHPDEGDFHTTLSASVRSTADARSGRCQPGLGNGPTRRNAGAPRVEGLRTVAPKDWARVKAPRLACRYRLVAPPDASRLDRNPPPGSRSLRRSVRGKPSRVFVS